MRTKSPTRDADAGSVVVPKQVHAIAAPASFNGLGLEAFPMEHPATRGSDATSYNVVVPSEGNDRYVASAPPSPSSWFLAAALNAVAAGHISPEGVERVMAALERDGR